MLGEPRGGARRRCLPPVPPRARGDPARGKGAVGALGPYVRHIARSPPRRLRWPRCQQVVTINHSLHHPPETGR